MTNYASSDYAALVLRIALGTMFVAHGLLKLLVFTLPGTAEFFAAVGFPAWLAYPVTFAEIGGGALLILGVQTRAVAVALLPIVLGAISVHFANGWVYTNANGGWEYAAFLSAAVVAQALLGDGAFALRLSQRELPDSHAEPAVS
jgi:putative oxidoreductase